jgi:NAD+ synthetase
MRLALAPINPTVGDIDGNAALIAAGIDKARVAGADAVVFPELALCGYPPRDLLLMEGFVPACAAAAKTIGESHTRGLTVIFGTPLPADQDKPGTSIRGRASVANSLVVYRDNKFVDYYDKRLLPTYDVFDEDRYFEPGDRTVLLGPPPHAPGLAICEDLWKGEDAGFSSRYHAAPDPVAALIAAGAGLILSPSASPFVLGKGEKHRAILKHHALKHHVYVASVNQLGGNDDLIFDGHAFVYGPGGELVAAGRGFSDEQLVVDLPPPPRGRGRGGRFEDLPTSSPSEGTKAATTSAPGASYDPNLPPRPLPREGGGSCLLLDSHDRLLFEALSLGIRDYLRKTGFAKAIIGLSGGIDSALTAVLAVAALGPQNVLGVAMPGKYSSEHSKTDAYDLAKRLNIKCPTIPIDQPFAGFHQALDAAFTQLGAPTMGAKLPDLTEENVQSRVRGSILMALSNRTGAMVLTTGNKSELAVGYCTLYGDMNGGLAVLSDVSKQLVYRLSRWINANPALCGFSQPPIPERSITKPPSAELRPDQTDQDTLPPYDILDQIIERCIEQHQSPTTIIKETGIDAATVRRVVRMIDVAEYKRKQTAVGLKVTTVAFGAGRRMPIAQKWKP